MIALQSMASPRQAVTVTSEEMCVIVNRAMIVATAMMLLGVCQYFVAMLPCCQLFSEHEHPGSLTPSTANSLQMPVKDPITDSISACFMHNNSLTISLELGPGHKHQLQCTAQSFSTLLWQLQCQFGSRVPACNFTRLQVMPQQL